MATSKCKAKNPSTCPYHGNIILMEQARDKGDFEGYFKYRTAAEANKNKGWNEEFALVLDEAVATKNFEGYYSLKKDFIPAAKEVVEEDSSDSNETIDVSHIPVEWQSEMFNSTSEDIRNGTIVADSLEVIEESTGQSLGTFHRSRPGVFPKEPYHIRIQANRSLSDDEIQHMTQLLGYAWRSTVAGERLEHFNRDTPRSFVVFADSTKGNPENLVDLEGKYPGFLIEGSPKRKTKNDTRLIEGVDENLKVEFYYDSVFDY